MTPATADGVATQKLMAGKTEAVQGIVAITGSTAEAVQGRALGAETPLESTAQKKRRHLKALVMYRQLLGIAGRPRNTEDGRVVKRGVSEKVQARLAKENGVTREQLLRRVKHFTRGVVIGSKGFVDDWLERNRSWLGGASAKNRKTGARRIDRTWGHLQNLRALRE